ncbi:hypothetical protein T069G_07387 [Trichoderma breve]|uniref:Uncharacterized protein n=1 Tax=Trichoderma breve TaxID=2034170 RepID=A0A9W9B9R6_9HYPO|nr:hypothetical protein T069G_07387 [Trichoderma breve]KAJ4859120.1 hypothetical protein T069G_07387 [Trichoderma breve]
MSPHIKHHHARASQELAQPIDKVSREGSSVGEQDCGPNPKTIYEEIVGRAVDIAEKKWPKYDSQAFEVHLRRLIKEYASHCAEHDASKSDEKARERKIERISEIITKEGDKIAHDFFTKIEKVRIHVHDVDKEHLHELGVQAKARIQALVKVHIHETVDKPVHETAGKPVHETVDDKFDEVDEIACKDYEKVAENPFDEFITDSDAETDNTYVEALRKLVKQVVACKFIIKVANKWEERRERKEENEKYEFNFKGFIKLFKDAANFKANFDPKSVEPTNFYTDFDFDGFVELFKDANNFSTGSDSEAVVKVPEDAVKFYTEFDLWGLVKLFKFATDFYTDFDVYAASDFEGFVELFEGEDDYVMVDRNTMMPSATGDEVLATEVTEKMGSRTRTWWFFW